MITFEKKVVLLLWSSLADYSIQCFKQLALYNTVELHIFYQSKSVNAPYDEFDLSFFKSHFEVQVTPIELLEKISNSINPQYIIMSSWNYKLYMNISKRFKKKGTKIISTFDGQWRGTLKQYIGILVSNYFLKPIIDNFFVPGDRQAVFSRKLGYKNPHFGYYSANESIFLREYKYENSFLFVGRLVSEKGIEYLIQAYKDYRQISKNPWNLIICGKGEMRKICDNIIGVVIIDFVQPKELPGIFNRARCLILPSYFEPWGLVIHEAVLGGLSIICSYNVGASTYFVRDGENGFIINPDKNSLINAMLSISYKSESELDYMSNTSKIIGQLWTSKKWASYVHNKILI